MTEPSHKFDYEEEARILLTAILRTPNIRSLMQIWAIEAQDVEDAGYGLMMGMLLNGSDGRLLDLWGGIIGEPRRGLLDGEYRRFVQARILSNLSTGTAPELIAILTLLTRADSVLYQPLYPAGMAFDFQSGAIVSPASRERILTQMLAVAPSGVAVDYITDGPLGSFGFDDDTTALGFGEGGLAETI